MKEQEVMIARLKEHFRIHNDDQPTPKLNEALEVAIASLEKQTPKKPILKSGNGAMSVSYEDGYSEITKNKWQDWTCPVCGWFVGQRYNASRSGSEKHPHDQMKSLFCNECGQAIDWSKEETEKALTEREVEE